MELTLIAIIDYAHVDREVRREQQKSKPNGTFPVGVSRRIHKNPTSETVLEDLEKFKVWSLETQNLVISEARDYANGTLNELQNKYPDFNFKIEGIDHLKLNIKIVGTHKDY